ncbi:ADP-ribosylation factor-like protein 9 [Stigmatopora nigra]
MGLKEAGFLGFFAALAGGLAYVAWNYTSFFSREVGKSCPEDSDGHESQTPGKEKTEKEDSGDGGEQNVAVDRLEPLCASVTEHKVSEKLGSQVLVLGLEGAGKSSLLYSMAIGSPETDAEPTAGFNAVSVNREGLRLEFLEIGGSAALRPYWSKYIPKALLLVFVVDSAAPQLFPEAKAHLHSVLSSHPHLPLMVLANKQDLEGACGITDLEDALALSELGTRKLLLIGTWVKKGQEQVSAGVLDARELIAEMAGAK